ncbi:hypothetical protein GQ41_3929 [Arenibacter algicola]|uniref:Uncharacterized protein n=1 Tax=Arenibacter algicola TaxID=616991 RepID=A0ABY3AEP8_9FLAO
MKKVDIDRYNKLKGKKKLSNNEFFEFSRLSIEKRKQDFEMNIIPDFEKFAKKFDFQLTHSFRELSRIILKKEGLEIFVVEEYQPRATYNINLKFSIDEEKKNYNLSNLVIVSENDLQLELNCFKERELINALHFIEKFFENKTIPVDVITIHK